MSKKVLIVLGEFSELVKAKEIRSFEDMVCVYLEDGDKVTTHKQNVVIYENGGLANKILEAIQENNEQGGGNDGKC